MRSSSRKVTILRCARIREHVAQLSSSLPSYQRIAHVHFWTGDLPKTSTLKEQRSKLRAQPLALFAARSEQCAGTRPVAPTAAAPLPNLPPCEQWVCVQLARLRRLRSEDITPEARLLIDLSLDWD
jgi:hypothetical protein